MMATTQDNRITDTSNELGLKKEISELIKKYNELCDRELAEDDENTYIYFDPDSELCQREALKSRIIEKKMELGELQYNKREKFSTNNYEKFSCDFSRSKERTEDYLKREKEIELLADRILNTNKKRIPNIGIFGNWGSGKTMYLQLLEKQIKHSKCGKDIHIIKYDAAAYENEQEIWMNLANSIYEEYERNKKFPLLSYYIEKAKGDIKTKYEKILIFIISVLFLSLLYYFFQIEENQISNAKDYIHELLSKSFWLAIFAILLPPLQKGVKKVCSYFNKLDTIIKFPNYNDSLGPRKKIINEMKVILKSWKNVKIILIIDDLDRCNDETIVSFFKAIQLFMPMENISFAFAIDQDILFKALTQKEVINVNSNDFKLKKQQFELYINKYIDEKIVLGVYRTDFPLHIFHEIIKSKIDTDDNLENNDKKKYILNEQQLKVISNEIFNFFTNPRDINMVVVELCRLIDLYMNTMENENTKLYNIEEFCLFYVWNRDRIDQIYEECNKIFLKKYDYGYLDIYDDIVKSCLFKELHNILYMSLRCHRRGLKLIDILDYTVLAKRVLLSIDE